MPYPFSRCVYICADPIIVPKDADEGEMERLRKRLETSLDEITDRADNYFK